MKIEIGQEVIVVGIGNNARYKTPIHKAIITKIGRKWFYVSTEGVYVGRDNKFSLEDGRSDGKGYSPDWCVYESEEARCEINELPNLMRKVSDALFDLNYKQLKDILTQITT